MENKNYIWRPVSEYTGGRVLATNGLDVLIGEINFEGDCESEEGGSTILCGITGFIKIEEMLPELKESEGERIRKWLIGYFNHHIIDGMPDVIDWLEKQGEMDMESYKAAEDEKREFVGVGFIKCYANFQDFKEGETYWLEYVGNDNYNVRSDNLLGKTYHITPCQLYTIFKKMTWLEKRGQTFTKRDVDDAYLSGEVGLFWNKTVTPPYLEPIPLTPEILEKNGFRKSVSPPGIHAKCYEINNKDEKYCLTIANYNKYKRLLLDIDSEDSECFNIKCDYVHQLQNALRLCEIEKEIIL